MAITYPSGFIGPKLPSIAATALQPNPNIRNGVAYSNPSAVPTPAAKPAAVPKPAAAVAAAPAAPTFTPEQVATAMHVALNTPPPAPVAAASVQSPTLQQPTLVPPVPVSTPASPAPAPVAPDAVSAAEKSYESLLNPSADEVSAKNAYSDLLAARDKQLGGLEGAGFGQIMPYLRGENERITKLAAPELTRLQDRAAQAQSQRMAALDASKFALDRADRAKADKAAANKPVELSPGTTYGRYNSDTNTFDNLYTAPNKPTEPTDPLTLIKEQQAAGITDSSKPYYFNGPAVIRKSDNHVYGNEQEAWADGVAKDFSNVEKPNVLQTPANILKKGNPEGSLVSTGSGTGTSAAKKPTQAQIKTGATNSGLTIDEFNRLPADQQARFITGDLSQKLPAAQKQTRKLYIDDNLASTGLGAIRQMIDDSNMTQPDKEELKAYAEVKWRALQK